jgi:hypothetical protein
MLQPFATRPVNMELVMICLDVLVMTGGLVLYVRPVSAIETTIIFDTQTARCSGCSGHGFCETPDTCTCNTGWMGGNCGTRKTIS